MTDAKQLRKQIKNIRDNMSVNEVEQFSARIEERLFLYIEDHPSIRHILCYYPKGNEAALLPLYRRLTGMYRLYFPVTEGDDISFYMPDSMKQESFEAGSFDVWEPKNRNNPFKGDDLTENNSIAIVPGLIFDSKTMGRIGYGKGYYDRFLKKYPKIFKIGVCYDFQVRENIPQSEDDVPMDMIYTNNKAYER